MNTMMTNSHHERQQTCRHPLQCASHDDCAISGQCAKHRQAGRPIGKLAFDFCHKRLPLEVLKSNAGFYIGTSGEFGPCSRESLEYFPTEAAANDALRDNTWTQRDEP